MHEHDPKRGTQEPKAVLTKGNKIESCQDNLILRL